MRSIRTIFTHFKQDLYKKDPKCFIRNNKDHSLKLNKNYIVMVLRYHNKQHQNSFNSILEAIKDDPLLCHKYIEKLSSGLTIIKLHDLIALFSYHDYLQGSPTNYYGQVGLMAQGSHHYIRNSDNIILGFPYKDTILKGGMTKDEHEIAISEPFLNETINEPEITELTEPKILINAKYYDKKHDGTPATSFNANKDNLFIKGNNLIALYSLLPKYRNQVKLIYLDPPYNTGDGDFPYNDRFSNATWLVFMKNRIEIAKKFLTDDGTIIIQTDDSEQAYLKVLMDEVLGNENYINTVSVLTKNIAGASGGGQDKRLKKNIEYLTIYSKDPHFNKIYSKVEISKVIKNYKKQGKSFKYNSILLNPGTPKYIGSTHDAKGHPIKIYKRVGYKLSSVSKLRKKYNLNTSDVFQKYGKLAFQTELPQSSIRVRVMNFYNHNQNQPLGKSGIISIKYVPTSGKNKGKEITQFYKGNNFRLFAWLKSVANTDNEGKIYKTQQLGTFWDMVGATKNVNREGKVKFNSGKKPEQLLYNIIKLTTKPHQLVMDFFAGSATTQAVAMKMKRQFIGVEQMDYPTSKTDSTPIYLKRLKRVINGDPSGISSEVNWHGGSSFIYAELKPLNQKYYDELNMDQGNGPRLDIDAKDIFSHAKLVATADLLHARQYYNRKLYGNNSKKKTIRHKYIYLMAVLDVNQNYYSYKNLGDSNIHVSAYDKAFNHNFYDKGGEK